ncbi:MAG: hypothetical protein H0T70_11295, partial [Acidimicrobiia bacterium]|nr:hypothetical protein [Acidimicrobiia bacterium]
MLSARPAVSAPPPRPADLVEVAGRARPVALAGERLLPVLPALRSLLPEGGLRRGSVVAVAGSTSLVLALMAGASAAGSWCAAVAVGRPSLHPEAAVEHGVALGRFPLVSAYAGTGPGGWSWVVAVLLDAVDVVAAWPPGHLPPADARRLVARARDRGAVLVVAGPNPGSVPERNAGSVPERSGWTEAVDVRLTVVASEWEGIGHGHGRLLARRVEVAATGRGAASRERRAVLWLPAHGGGV